MPLLRALSAIAFALCATAAFAEEPGSLREETAKLQQPFTGGALPGREIDRVPPESVVAGSAPGAEDFAPGTATAAEEAAWAAVKGTSDRDELRAFILSFPRGVHASAAFEMIVGLAAKRDEAPREVTDAVADVPAEPAAEPVGAEPAVDQPAGAEVAAVPAAATPVPPTDPVFRGPCAGIYAAWKMQPAPKAFAGNAELTFCGYAHSWASLKGAEDEALRACAAQKGGACAIVAGTDRP